MIDRISFGKSSEGKEDKIIDFFHNRFARFSDNDFKSKYWRKVMEMTSVELNKSIDDKKVGNSFALLEVVPFKSAGGEGVGPIIKSYDGYYKYYFCRVLDKIVEDSKSLENLPNSNCKRCIVALGEESGNMVYKYFKESLDLSSFKKDIWGNVQNLNFSAYTIEREGYNIEVVFSYHPSARSLNTNGSYKKARNL